MRHSHWSLVGALSVAVALVTTSGAAEKVPVATRPATLKRFPGDVCHVLQQLDGSAICSTFEGVFVSVGDLHCWRPAPGLPQRELFSRAGERLAGYSNFRPVGGDQSRFFVAGDMYDFNPQLAEKQGAGGNYYCLAALDAGGKFGVVWDRPPSGAYDFAHKLAAFGSKNVGALGWSEDVTGAFGTIAVRNNLLLTADGGATWKGVSPPASATTSGNISRLLWVSPSRLLVSFADATVQLFEKKGPARLERGWSATVPAGSPGTYLVLDGDYVWVGGDSMKRLRLADGREDASVKVEPPVLDAGGMAACHQCLLVWGLDQVPSAPRIKGPGDERRVPAKEPEPAPGRHLDVWGRDPKVGFVRRARIAVPSIVGVLPLQVPLCLILTADGEGLHLDLDKAKLSPVALQVTPLPPPAVDVDATIERQWKETLELARQVPADEREALFKAASKSGLTGTQLGDLTNKLFREYLEKHKPQPAEKK